MCALLICRYKTFPIYEYIVLLLCKVHPLAYLYNISQGCDYKQEMDMVIVLKVTLSKWVLVYRDRTVSMDIFTTNRPRTVQMAFTPGIQE